MKTTTLFAKTASSRRRAKPCLLIHSMRGRADAAQRELPAQPHPVPLAGLAGRRPPDRELRAVRRLWGAGRPQQPGPGPRPEGERLPDRGDLPGLPPRDRQRQGADGCRASRPPGPRHREDHRPAGPPGPDRREETVMTTTAVDDQHAADPHAITVGAYVRTPNGRSG